MILVYLPSTKLPNFDSLQGNRNFSTFRTFQVSCMFTNRFVEFFFRYGIFQN